jgi:hypothetical protein
LIQTRLCRSIAAMFPKVLSLCLFVAVFVLHAQTATAVRVIKASPAHADALYKVSETATFTIEVSEDGPPLSSDTVACVFSKVCAATAATHDQREGRQGHYHRQARRAGLSLVTYDERQGDDAGQRRLWSTFLKPSMPVPEDFDTFWTTQKAKVPMCSLTTPLHLRSPNSCRTAPSNMCE